ncbi:1-(5-phosphoribosyl)-5-((5-phosphoribosylamino)methylideneamino)imidazole-4-carboxamide isomerase [Sulfodiicoccus acidiphilus]|uniref:1-(5-phosphoribosyl)-5-((5-phosphoribosylamino)methylideneamino)imidazole-4-carboxamide isomerase n=1 Tax=Sulfodiicoccus acidiphilus TaxID=1670455 RepID=A0A348B732_9CREN|nr:1-(5-phosphoribosyl)-5-((5-phosphoribosylamino)methylideneamino)imidazole-4-carboxamide isomerase [Sulfodiicoccus acidiphilus]BBD73984.1 1-(5-phosphoribosyl)-5-((5-phosphoribosylamino)methylideneamino)imidazole-4-carboxamide isomerase [Sulfodiicoccus acidiphilus]GGU02655.1 1-(5-phosphoribosyl)-5-((5-phosphoribosylamino)methylideneamino)imidazole-4-carboxamide isomerase [Sulfodiicoccus acidiphilus]
MKVIPALDVSSRLVVKRVRGIPGTGLVVGDPMKVAREVLEEGYDSLHLVDLDAAAGTGDNSATLLKVLKLPFKWIQVGGGVRSLDRANLYLKSGASAIVFSTLPFTDPEKFDYITREIGKDKVLVSLDYANGRILTRGWTVSSISLDQAISKVGKMDVKGTVLTHVGTEGTEGGVDEGALIVAKGLRGLKEYAGGVSTMEHLLKIKSAGFDAVLLGMAFHDRKLRGVVDV